MFSAPADDPWANKADDDDEWDTDPDFENKATIKTGTKDADATIVSAADAQRRLREQLEEESAKKFGVPKSVAVEKSTAHLGNLGEKPAPARPWQQQQQQQAPPPVVSSSTQQVNVNPVSAARNQFSQAAPAPVRSFGAPAAAKPPIQAAPPAAAPPPAFAAAPPPAAKPAPAPAPAAAPPPAARPPPPPAASKPAPPPVAAKPSIQAAPPAAAPPPPAPAQIYEEPAPAASYDDGSSYDQGGYDDGSSYDQGGYQEGGYDDGSYHQEGGYDQSYDQGGYDQSGYDQSYDQSGYDQSYDQSGHDQNHAKQCRALYDFTGENETDLAFYEGSIINVVNDTDPSGWWEGELNGVVGFFPSNFVELI